MARVCPCGPCEEIVDVYDWRCPSCGKDLVGKTGSAARDSRSRGG